MINNVPMIRLGDYIEIFEIRNRDGHNYPFMGVNKDKAFMPTVADTNELDNTKYKVVSKDMFVFSGMQTGRDTCIRLALYSDNTPALISPAYTTFVIKDKSKLIPGFLFLFFYRYEMDRLGAFLSDSSIRSNLDWDRFCDIQIPLPSIETQRALVALYDGLQKTIAENEALIKEMESVCHAFVVDCKTKYPKVKLGEWITECDERNSDNTLTLDALKGISTSKVFIETKANMDGVSLTSYKIVAPHEFAYVSDTSRRGDKIALAFNNEKEKVLISSIYTVFRSKDENVLSPEYLYLLFNRTEFDRYSRFNSWGSARETFDWAEMCYVKIPLPPIELQRSITEVFNCLQESKRIVQETRELMKNLCPALVQKAAHSA